MSDVTDANPFASPAAVNEGYQAAVDATKPVPFGNPKWDYLILTGIIITCTLGMGFVFLATDSITFSGGILVALSALLLARDQVVSRRGRRMWILGRIAAVFGLTGPIGIFALICVNQWSPTQAEQAGVPFAVVMLGLTIIAMSLLACFHVPRSALFSSEDYSAK